MKNQSFTHIYHTLVVGLGPGRGSSIGQPDRQTNTQTDIVAYIITHESIRPSGCKNVISEISAESPNFQSMELPLVNKQCTQCEKYPNLCSQGPDITGITNQLDNLCVNQTNLIIYLQLCLVLMKNNAMLQNTPITMVCKAYSVCRLQAEVIREGNRHLQGGTLANQEQQSQL